MSAGAETPETVQSAGQIGRFEILEMPGGEQVYFDPDPHRYYTAVKESPKAKGGYSYVQGSQVPGVSTIAGYSDSGGDGLLHWAAGLDRQGIADLVRADVAAGRSLDWLTFADQITDRLKEEKRTWSDVRDGLAEIGTNIHQYVLLAMARGETPNLRDFPAEERGFGQAAMAWWRNTKPDVLQAECATASLSRGFCGQLDLRARFTDRDGDTIGLVDAKTRSSGKVRAKDFVQTAGYELANVDCGYGPSDWQMVLVLMPDGTYREELSTATAADFLASFNQYRSTKHLETEIRRRESARKKAGL